jgi:hypothetical protein
MMANAAVRVSRWFPSLLLNSLPRVPISPSNRDAKGNSSGDKRNKASFTFL